MSYSQYFEDSKVNESLHSPRQGSMSQCLSTVHEVDNEASMTHPPPSLLHSPPPPPQDMREATISASKCREVGKLFPIPVMPKLVKIVEPQPMKRIVPGYDMRTLRKQVDTMHSEIAQRVDLQDKLYHQNDVMFTYIAELLKAQKKNSRTMKTHVVALQQEVCTLHQEREVLVSKVTEAMTTKEAIRNIEVQQQQLEERVLVAQQARREAVAAGQQQEQHNQDIEAQLKDSITQMQALHLQLEDLRHQQQEEEADDRAEHFFRTSKVILGGAFARLKASLRSWRAKRLAAHAFRTHRARVLLRVHYQQWFQYLRIARLIKTNALKRTFTFTRLCMAKWRVYTALEQFGHRARRRRLLKRMMSGWRSLVVMRCQEERADELLSKFEHTRYLRHLFLSWKKGIVFLEWQSEELREKGCVARLHLLARLVRLWRMVVVSTRGEVVRRATAAARVCALRFPLRLWRLVAAAGRLRSSLLVRRGVTGLRLYAKLRKRHKHLQRVMGQEAPDIRLRGCLKRWRRRALEKKYHQHHLRSPLPPSFSSPSEVELSTELRPVSTRLVELGKRGVWHEEQYSYRLYQLHRRKGFSALLKWARCASRMRNIRLGHNLGSRHDLLSSQKKCLKRWFFNTCLRKRAQLEVEEDLKRTMFEAWCVFVPQEARQKHLDRQVEQRWWLRQASYQSSLLRRWRRRARKRCRLKHSLARTQDKVHTFASRRFFSSWRGIWAKQLLWRERECQVSAKKSFSLVELKMSELEDCGREKALLEGELEDTREALEGVKAALARRTEEVLEQEEAVRVAREQVLQLQQALKQTQTALKDVNEERKRLRLIEEVFEHDQDTIRQQQQAMQQEASLVLSSLQASTQELRQEATEAQSFVEQAQEQAMRSLALGEETLEQSMLASNGLQQRVMAKAQQVEQEEAERDSVLAAICRVKEQLQSVSDDMSFTSPTHPSPDSHTATGLSGFSSSRSSSDSSKVSFFEEIQGDIRHKESEVQTLRQQTGQAEARVSSLREAIATRKLQMSRASRMDEERLAQSDRQEMDSLSEQQQRQPYKRHTDADFVSSGNQHSMHNIGSNSGSDRRGGSSLRLSQLSGSPERGAAKQRQEAFVDADHAAAVIGSRSPVTHQRHHHSLSALSSALPSSPPDVRTTSSDIERAVKSINKRIHSRFQ